MVCTVNPTMEGLTVFSESDLQVPAAWLLQNECRPRRVSWHMKVRKAHGLFLQNVLFFLQEMLVQFLNENVCNSFFLKVVF